MTTLNYFTGMIIDNTQGKTLDKWLNETIRTAIGTDGDGTLPEKVADLFTTKAIDVEGETRVIIDWA